MKINNKKIIVSTLALAMGAALAGSISGSVAWYQYSTRASAQIVGTSAGTEGRLQVKEFSAADTTYDNHIELFDAAEFKPLSVKKEGTSLTFYEHPVYQYPNLTAAATDGTAGYHDYELSFRFQTNEKKEQDWQDVTDKDIYLSYFAIEPKTGDVDVTAAGKVNFILGSSTTAVETSIKAKLDMNKNTKLDTNYWDCQDDPAAAGATQIEYTTGAASYSTNAHSDVLADTSDPFDLETANSGKALTNTAAGNKLIVRVWIEGFAQIGGETIWDAETIAQTFNINMQFQCTADK